MMFRQYLILFLFLIGFLFSEAQDKQIHFTLSDTLFKSGSFIRTYSIKYGIGQCLMDSLSYPFLDSLVDFLRRNEKLKIEIQRHDKKPSPVESVHYADCRAKSIMAYLINKGIHKDRLNSKGFNGSHYLIPQKRIDGAKTKDERMKLYLTNIRIEFIIIST